MAADSVKKMNLALRMAIVSDDKVTGDEAALLVKQARTLGRDAGLVLIEGFFNKPDVFDADASGAIGRFVIEELDARPEPTPIPVPDPKPPKPVPNPATMSDLEKAFRALFADGLVDESDAKTLVMWANSGGGKVSQQDQSAYREWLLANNQKITPAAQGIIANFLKSQQTDPLPTPPPTPPSPDNQSAGLDRAFVDAVSDSWLDKGDADKIVAAAKDGGVTPAKRERFRQLALTYVEHTAPDAQIVLTKFLMDTATPGPTPLPDPVPGPDVNSVERLEEAWAQSLNSGELARGNVMSVISLVEENGVTAAERARFVELANVSWSTLGESEAARPILEFCERHPKEGDAPTPTPNPNPIDPNRNSIAPIEPAFVAALADQKLDAAEAAAIIKNVEKDGVTDDEKAAVRTQLSNSFRKMDDPTQQVFIDFLMRQTTPTPPPPGPGPNPDGGRKLDAMGNGAPGKLRDPEGGFAPPPAGAKLVQNGLNVDDTMQGVLGDCYFLAAIAAAASSRPEILENMIKENGDGTFTVTFQGMYPDGRFEAVPITIDGDVKRGYARSRDPKELWPALLEKAYMQWKGGSGAIGNGGLPSRAMQSLTGKPSKSEYVQYKRADELWQTMKAGTDNKSVMCTWTMGGSRGIPGGHAYTVIGAYEENGKKFIKIRNPWGHTEPGGDGKNDGIYTLTPEQFQRAFFQLDVNPG